MLPARDPDQQKRPRVGRYTVTSRIGRGGMGMVYRGYDAMLEREVAIKTLTAEGSFDEESRKRFEIEAKAAARLQHPNILTVFELGEDRGIPFIAMELLAGADLESVLRSGEALTLQEKLEIVIQVCRGLAYAHEHKIVHRDIKPSNIRLLDDGSAKIMDFGIAKLQGTGVTKTGMMVGTVHYMSPEQIRAQPLDGRSDVFSLGVILYELLAGRRPFPGEGSTQVLYKIIHEEPPPLEVEPGEVGRRLSHIVSRALAKDRDARIPSAASLGDELAEALAEHLRTLRPPAAEDAEAVAGGRALLRDGSPEEAAACLEAVVERSPDCLEARRALRAARREKQRRLRAQEPEGQGFPELEATFQSAPTRREPETVVQPSDPTVQYARDAAATPAAAPAPAPARTGLMLAALAALLVAAVAGALLLRGRPEPAAPAAPRPAGPAAPVAPGPASAVSRASVPVSSDPAGASVTLDGKKVEGTTPLTLELDPSRPHQVRLVREGFSPAELRVEAQSVPGEIRLTLEPAGPPGAVTVASSYAVDVAFRGRVLARGQVAPRLLLPAGRQTLTISSDKYFFRTTATVDVRAGGAATVDVPSLGRISIRANPDNCEVFIDGFFVDYPPILDRPVAAGSRSVAFKWPDGTRREELAQVPTGGVVYVTGRKD